MDWGMRALFVCESEGSGWGLIEDSGHWGLDLRD